MFTSCLISTLLHKSRFTTYTSFNLVWPLSGAHSVWQEETEKKDEDDDRLRKIQVDENKQRKHNLKGGDGGYAGPERKGAMKRILKMSIFVVGSKAMTPPSMV